MQVIFDPLLGRLALVPSSSGGSPGATVDDEFIAAEAQTTYNLTGAPSLVAVYINGLLQSESEYTLSTNHLVFNDGQGIVAGDIIRVVST